MSVLNALDTQFFLCVWLIQDIPLYALFDLIIQSFLCFFFGNGYLSIFK